MNALKPLLLPEKYQDLHLTFEGMQREILKLMEVVTFNAEGYPVIPLGLEDYADDAAAQSGGIPLNGIYRNGSVLMIRVA
jgi:hypothetical protein